MGKEMTLQEAQTAVVAMMQAHGISAVLISADGKHNRYTLESSNGGGGVFYSFDTLEELAERVTIKGELVQRGLFE